MNFHHFSVSLFHRAGLVALVALVLCVSFPPSSFAEREVGLTPGSAQAKQLDTRAQRFAELWVARRTREVAPQLVKMLKEEPTVELRRALVTGLGRLEDPQAEKPLQLLLKQRLKDTTSRRDQIEPFRIQLAIGRIRARNLKGKARLDIIARAVGKNWASLQQDAKRLRLRLQDRLGIYEAQKSDDRFIIEEFYDVLYRMGKRGENIRGLGAYNLILWPQQKPLLSASALSDKEESRFWIQRALPPSSLGLYPSHLLDLGPQVKDELLQAMKTALATVKRDPTTAKDKNIVGLRSLFIAAVATGDKRFIPLLRAFDAVPDNDVRFYASHAIQRLEEGQPLASIAFP